MVEIYEVLEIAGPNGEGIGKWRYTRRADDPASDPIGLCDHQHDNIAEAEACSDAKAIVDRAFGRDLETLKRRLEQKRSEVADLERQIGDFEEASE